MSDKSLNSMIRSVVNATHKVRHMKTVNESNLYEATKKIEAPAGYHFMKKGRNEYKLMKDPEGGYKPHKTASKEAEFDIQKIHVESYFYEKDDEDHNPVDHVKEKEDGTFCVYDIEGNIVAEFDEEEDAIGYAIKNHDDLMNVRESRHKKSKNRELLDKMRSKGRVAPIDRERYPNREREGLEGPYRSRKSGRIYYYDKKAGEFYDPDTDIYLQVDDVE